MSECLIYQLKPGRTMVSDFVVMSTVDNIDIVKVGRLDSEKPAVIRLSGDNILEEHCFIDNNEGKVTIHSMPDSVTVGTCSFMFAVHTLTWLPVQFLNGKQISPGQVSDAYLV